MTHDDCGQVSRLAPGFALGPLDPKESAELRDHLATCGRRHPGLREAMALAAAMADSAPDALASAALRARVLAAARSETTSAHAAPVRNERRIDRGALAWWRAIAAGTTAVALAASVALAVQVGENRSLTERAAAVEGRLAAVASDLETARTWIDRAVARGTTAYFEPEGGSAAPSDGEVIMQGQLPFREG